MHIQTKEPTPSQDDEWGSDDDEDDEPEEKDADVGAAVCSGMMLYAFTGMCTSPPPTQSIWGAGGGGGEWITHTHTHTHTHTPPSSI